MNWFPFQIVRAVQNFGNVYASSLKRFIKSQSLSLPYPYNMVDLLKKNGHVDL